MRIGVVREDMGNGVYLDDILSRNQYPYASQVPGQSRVIRRPTDAELTAAIAATPAPVFLLGTDTDASVDTSVNDTLRIRQSPEDDYTVIAVTAGAATAKTAIRDDLNAAFTANDLNFLASIEGTNQIQITSVDPNVGPSARLDIDTIANGSTLSTPLGFADGATITGTATATLLSDIKTAVYPTTTTIDVSSATIIGANADLGNLSADDQTTIVTAIADLVAPQLVETGYLLLSLVKGKLSSLVDSGFQPGGARVGLSAGEAVALVENDGSTPFTYPL